MGSPSPVVYVSPRATACVTEAAPSLPPAGYSLFIRESRPVRLQWQCRQSPVSDSAPGCSDYCSSTDCT